MVWDSVVYEMSELFDCRSGQRIPLRTKQGVHVAAQTNENGLFGVGSWVEVKTWVRGNASIMIDLVLYRAVFGRRKATGTVASAFKISKEQNRACSVNGVVSDARAQGCLW